jgi:2-desacetyl-2-hydroxyethyl bacteriochlorophyllide A dehydrogenase
MMEVQTLICNAQQQFSLKTFEIPELAPTEILVRTRYSGVSVGTEFAVIRGKLDWGPYPLCTGYQAVGVVEQVGAKVRDYQVGDKVYYCRNYMHMALNGEPVNTAAGTHCSTAVIDPARAEGIAHLPQGVDEATGSMFVMPSVGFNAVDMAGVQLGETVVLHGSGLIGLGALSAARLRGATTIAVDINPRKLDLARQLGADYTINSQAEDLAARMQAICPDGADVVFEATGIPACLDTAFALCRSHGKFVFLGNYGNAPISFHFLVPHVKQLTAFFPCNDGLAPCRRAVLKNIATGAIPWEKTISHRVPAAEAPALYEAINQGQADEVMGAVIKWS